MAVHAPITGAPMCAPAIARRSMLAILAAAPAVVGTAAVASPAADTVDTTAWDRALAAFDEAERTVDAYDANVWMPCHEALGRVAPWSDGSFEVPTRSGGTVCYTLPIDQPDKFDNHHREDVRDGAAAVRAARERRRIEGKRIDYDRITGECERLMGVRLDTHTEALLTPAPHLAALFWKIDQLYGDAAGRVPGGDGDAWCGEYLDALMADARRLIREDRS